MDINQAVPFIPNWGNALKTDLDNNQELNESEFASLLETHLGPELSSDIASSKFQEISSNGESISQADFYQHVIEKHRPKLDYLSETAWEELLSEADTDGDGLISQDELKAFLETKFGGTQFPQLFDAFFSSLAGEDQLISQSEFEAFQGHLNALQGIEPA